MRLCDTEHPALLAVLAVACGGGAGTTPPPAEPVHPGPIVASTPPAPAAAHPSATSAPPATGPKPTTPPAVNEPTLHCAMNGRAEFAPNTLLEDASNRPVARFTGAALTVAVSELTLGSSPRARLETGEARGSFRLRGWVAANKLPVFTETSVPIASGHLYIDDHRGVTIETTSGDQLKIQRVATPPLEQTFSAWTKCSALRLDPGTPGGWSPPGDARGFALRKATLELFDAPAGSAVGAVNKAPASAAVLFFSSEQRGGWVHVERHADIVVDAWAKASDLSALPRGETLDEPLVPASTRGAVRLALPTEPRVVRTGREVPLRASASDSAPLIGSIAPDAETYVLETVAGWVSVLPKTLELMPREGGGFWAKSTDLGV